MDSTTIPDTLPSTTKLAALLPILDAFNHRHRNQHAASPWWSCFRLFRRGARCLYDDLRRHQAAQAKLLHGDAKKGGSSTSAKSKAKTAQKQLLARVMLLRDHSVPKSYICFSQLIADNQHAALGLLLLSALASVNSVLESIAPRPPPPENHILLPSSSFVSATQRIVQKPSRPAKTEPTRDDTDATSADKGVAISRDQISGALLKPSKIERAARDDNDDVALLKRDRDVPPPPNKKKLLIQSVEQPEEKLKKKKSKKKGKGDELSSLFGSL